MSGRVLSTGNHVVLSSRHACLLGRTLSEFRLSAEAVYAALLEESGTILTDLPENRPDCADIIGALANGAYFAVQELSKRLGDDACEGLFHQGRSRHFCLSPLTPTVFLLTVFGNETRLGIVRSALSQFSPVLRDQLDEAFASSITDPLQEGDIVLENFSLGPV